MTLTNPYMVVSQNKGTQYPELVRQGTLTFQALQAMSVEKSTKSERPKTQQTNVDPQLTSPLLLRVLICGSIIIPIKGKGLLMTGLH